MEYNKTATFIVTFPFVIFLILKPTVGIMSSLNCPDCKNVNDIRNMKCVGNPFFCTRTDSLHPLPGRVAGAHEFGVAVTGSSSTFPFACRTRQTRGRSVQDPPCLRAHVRSKKKSGI